ncbi:hypothetical protein GCM10009764_15980 [Nocardia ninae]
MITAGAPIAADNTTGIAAPEPDSATTAGPATATSTMTMGSVLASTDLLPREAFEHSRLRFPGSLILSREWVTRWRRVFKELDMPNSPSW